LILYRATKKTYINGESVEMIIRKNKKPKSLKKAKYSKEQISELEYEILRMMIRTEPSNRQLSVEILQSSELRKLVKDFSLDMKTSGSSSTSSNNK
jgi:DNA polymerase sigma